MKKITMLLLGLIFAFSIQAQEMTLEEILESYYEVTGIEELASLETLVFKGKSVNQGMENNYTMTMMMPDRYRLDVPVQGQNMVQVYSNGEAWMIAPWTGSMDPRDITGDQLKRMAKQADPTGDLYNWKEKGNTLELLGTDDMEGSEVYKIKCVDKNGDNTVYYIDAENFVVLKEETTAMMRGEEVKTETFVSDYKPVGDMVIPHSYQVSYQGQVVSQVLIDEVILNPDVDSEMFNRPAAASATDSE